MSQGIRDGEPRIESRIGVHGIRCEARNRGFQCDNSRGHGGPHTNNEGTYRDHASESWIEGETVKHQDPPRRIPNSVQVMVGVREHGHGSPVSISRIRQLWSNEKKAWVEIGEPRAVVSVPVRCHNCRTGDHPEIDLIDMLAWIAEHDPRMLLRALDAALASSVKASSVKPAVPSFSADVAGMDDLAVVHAAVVHAVTKAVAGFNSIEDDFVLGWLTNPEVDLHLACSNPMRHEWITWPARGGCRIACARCGLKLKRLYQDTEGESISRIRSALEMMVHNGPACSPTAYSP